MSEAPTGGPMGGAPVAPMPTGGMNPVNPSDGPLTDGPDPALPQPSSDTPSNDTPMQMDPACGAMGLALDGLMYSPGGTVLPHPCEPFHPTHNNPYAIKCVEAWDWYQTAFPGDEYCILPPEPDKGIQIGVHPQGADWYGQVSQGDLSGYDNVSQDFLMEPGAEAERNYRAHSPSDSDLKYYRSYTRMRAGSHHMIVNAVEPNGTAGRWTVDSGGGVGNAIEGLFGGTGIPGAQRPDANVPQSLEKPGEDDGLFRLLPGGTEIVYNMHHFNASDKATLKEAWQNLWFEEDATVEEHGIFGMPILEAFGVFANPGDVVDHHFSWPAQPSDLRMVQVFGHRHAWTTNFSAWVEDANGDVEVIYQSFDWYDMPTYRFDSVTENPAMDAAALKDGATSGIRVIKQGERLHFNCHMEYTPERAASEGAPMPSSIGPLRFANQAFTGEMCILFGSTAGRELENPIRDPSPVPAFAR